MSPERFAFDIQFYTDRKKNEASQRLASDLASLALELAPDPQKRITPYQLVQTQEGKVISPEFSDTDIQEFLSWESRLDILEAKATLRIRDCILTQEAPFIVIWISPADEKLGYNEGRMVIGIGEREDGLNTVENYGICINFSSEDCLLLANQLLTFSENDCQGIDTTDQLRAQPIFIKPTQGVEPLDFMAELIPSFVNVLARIKNGEAEALKEQALNDARTIARKVMPQIMQLETENRRGLIAVGAYAEQQMMAAGWGMRANSGCGFLNTDFLSSSTISVFSYSHLHLGTGGNLTLRKSEAGVFVKNCPYCGRVINEIIKPGYHCQCGKVYRGVC